MDGKPLARLSHPDFDILAVWDYRSPAFDLALVEDYDEICVIAWSFGVYAAQRVLPWLSQNLSACIAVGGTPYPVDDLRGIPEKVFNATVDAMSERNLQKFYRRMCGSTEAYGKFATTLPDRDIDGLVEELRAISRDEITPLGTWTLALITTDDAIFPAGNQRRGWAQTRTVEMPWHHFPDFQYIIDNYLINKSLVQKRFTEAGKTYDEEADVQRLIGAQLWNLLSREKEALSGKILEVGPGTGIFTSFYIDALNNADCLCFIDLTPRQVPVREGIPTQYMQEDAEMAIRTVKSESLDAVLTNCAMQWFSDGIGFARHAMRTLKPGGVFAFSTFLPDNLEEFRQAAGIAGLPTPTPGQWSALADETASGWTRKGFCHTLEFSSPMEVLRHLRRTGVNAVKAAVWTATRLERFCADYPRTERGTCPLTYRATTQVWTK